MAKYQWINKPPIIQVKKESVLLGYRKQLLRNIENWRLAEPDYDVPPEIEGWNSRCGYSDSIATLVKNEDFNFVYLLEGVPVGIMTMSDYLLPYINDLVLHPGSEGGGAIMIEHAVNFSRGMGYGGKLELWSYNGESTKFYLKMGFTGVDSGSGSMTLDPATSDLWDTAGNRYHLKKYAAQTAYLYCLPPLKKPLPPIPKKPLPRKPLPPIPTASSQPRPTRPLPPVPNRSIPAVPNRPPPPVPDH
ncbi:GNAT family N-acetyltransferase [Exilibacterium tricleocarpae]|uniref:GNAT family N-acetyltransferase n=1 Tax=Exilibacterium tricleocarpae TaxID=2591008 RepID=A0A545UBC5_9GAMM|nr:GNAT family N-acetyltransferase [Exilibacterium tricleocarpae]TQV86768.1 GNAT family N-acetyltransferase [Exilibacterium tricleocarpae]